MNNRQRRIERLRKEQEIKIITNMQKKYISNLVQKAVELIGEVFKEVIEAAIDFTNAISEFLASISIPEELITIQPLVLHQPPLSISKDVGER